MHPRPCLSDCLPVADLGIPHSKNNAHQWFKLKVENGLVLCFKL